ncbi:PPM-type phosphatase domain-containing protein [Nocardioides dubius]|uniref:PP2C family protein-serine/threonine phosphatase n=1 Tax=Nocardioides dubius TaxID=317019 RepID=UPI0039ED1750
MLRFTGAGITDVGLVRDHNEDAGFVGPYLVLVADGVGGAAAGEVASATVAHAVASRALAHPEEPPLDLLAEAVDVARDEVVAGSADPARAGMATTLTALATDGVVVALAHIGDSRAYALTDQGLVRLTRDHTWVQEMVEEGRLSAEQAAGHAWRNVVLRSLPGEGESGHADLVMLELAPATRVLLCSDGLTDLVSDERIAALLVEPSADAAASALVQAALAAGGHDNITCIVVDLVDDDRRVCGDGTLLGSLRDFRNIVDPASPNLR